MTLGQQHLDVSLRIMNFYRDAELQGARLVLNLHRHLLDKDSQIKLSRHLMDETRHALLWTKRICDLGGTPIAVADGYQRRIGQRIGVPRDEVALLALTLIAENRALLRYLNHAEQPDVDEDTLEVLKAVTDDEHWHLHWIGEKLSELAEERDEQERASRLVERYQAVEREVYATFEVEEAELVGRL